MFTHPTRLALFSALALFMTVTLGHGGCTVPEDAAPVLASGKVLELSDDIAAEEGCDNEAEALASKQLALQADAALAENPPALTELREEGRLEADTLDERHGIAPSASMADRFDAIKARFTLQAGDLVIPYRVFGVFVMPNETIPLEVLFQQPGRAYSVSHEEGTLEEESNGSWQWTAPSTPGTTTLYVSNGEAEVQLNVFILTPFDNNNPTLENYRIGSYQKRPLRGDPQFLPPKGLFRLTNENALTKVSPHFTVGEFASHQPGAPKFLLVDERLLLKLEMLLQEVNESGIEARTFHVMSAYRTPYYNRSIGNTTTYSLHLFGRATDIFIDNDRDGRMDDINDDGRINAKDAQVLYDLVESLKGEAWYRPFLGGLGLYGPKPHRGPFIHVDVRGHTARWLNP